MAYNANYPISADVLANPTNLTNRDDVGFELHGVISRIQDILEALEAKVGIGASTPGASAAVLRRTGSGASAWGQLATGDISDGQITQQKLANDLVGTFRSVTFGPVSTPSTSYVGMTGSNLPGFTGRGRPMLLGMSLLSMANTTATGQSQVQVWDGSQGNAVIATMSNDVYTAAGYRATAAMALVVPTAALSHGYFLVWNTTAGTIGHQGGVFWAVEIQ